MKRLLACFAILFFPLAAHASPELAKQWGDAAGELRELSADLMGEVDMGLTPELDADYEVDVYRFGRTSAGLAVWIDSSKGPSDLGCIFRGMAAESEQQVVKLHDMSDPLETRETLYRLTKMFEDAQAIARSAQYRTAAPAYRAYASKTCMADASASLRALRH